MKKILCMLLSAIMLTPAISAQSPISDYVQAALSEGIVSGDENGNIGADKFATRAEFVSMLTRFLNISGGMNVFPDISRDAWYEPSFSAAYHYGLISGYADKNAHPNELITLVDAQSVLSRAFDTAVVISQDKPSSYVTKGEILKTMFDYDMQSTSLLRFINGYPRLSHDGLFNRISIDIKTNKPCTVYYSLSENDTPASGNFSELCKISDTRNAVSASIGASLSHKYDIYLKAVSTGDITQCTAVLKDVSPFAIASGNGSEAMPYIIYTAQQLEQISARPDKHYRLGADIKDVGDWDGIDDFFGTFDGGGYQISGIVIDNGSEDAGLFKKISGGTVKNLSVHADIKTKKNAGIIAGQLIGGSISNCTVSGTVASYSASAGGICGQNTGYITNCTAAPYSVASSSYAGGICGQNDGRINSSIAASTITAADLYTGGISGINRGSITSCISACMTIYDTLSARSGRLTSNQKGGTISNSYCYKDVNSNKPYQEPNPSDTSGGDVSWDELCDSDFYAEAGFDTGEWRMPSDNFRLISPKSAPVPYLVPGETVYSPAPVSSAAQLRAIDENPSGHFILTGNITLGTPWKTICRDGFSGSLDGNGYTIYNLHLKGDSGMFSNITGGTLRNLTLSGVSAAPSASGGVLSACNYGYILNCSVDGKIETKKSGYVGGICGENHGRIDGCTSDMDISVKSNNVTAGGICAENSGLITNSVYRGTLSCESKNAVLGSAAGYNIGGDIFSFSATSSISAKTASGYVGGVCGINEGGNIYKSFSLGALSTESCESIYIGGISGLSQNSAVYNCFSASDIYTSSISGYAGGICGYLSEANVQNTYSSGTVTAIGEMFAGGICGYSENGFVMQNVALNPSINGNGRLGAIIGNSTFGETGDNFCSDLLMINSKHVYGTVAGGEIKSMDILKTSDFYFAPLSAGGVLGWECSESGEAPWGSTALRGYSFPHLLGVRGQDKLKMPSYK